MSKYFGIWQSVIDIANDYGANYVTAAAWTQRGEIPRTHDFTTLRVIKARGFTTTPEELDRWHNAHKDFRAKLRNGSPEGDIVYPALPFRGLPGVEAAE
ncbi:hypothetical protein [Thalassovita aquimarina]|uniref:Uncharacterized protein n=1 Tax=Thalassovita aquimarina TaxID=2785917 RepID=A0ABS5HSE4_9RHOB|nr:hypothetical protein [Thalassovita aquimarina]MBR9651894.1 hypothetical protein [Thalassovita aquimarina]